MSQPQLRVEYALFCDDVRREETGKFIFIGVYTNGLVVPRYPVSIHLAFFIHATHERAGELPFEFRVMYLPGDLQIFSGEATATLTQTADGPGSLDLSFPFQFQAQRDGHLSLQLRQGEGRWDELSRLPVEAGKAPNRELGRAHV